MITSKDIQYSSTSYWDPTGRVFFAKGRVFRAISHEMEIEVLQFLQSPLYGELIEKELFVKTWITNDVQLTGYSKIVEHERIIPLPDYQLITPAEMKDVCLFLIQIQNICLKYGYTLLDAGLSNVGYKNGHLCFLDLGSFFGKNNNGFYISLAPNLYLLQQCSLGQNEFAHTLKPEQLTCTAFFPQVVFASTLEFLRAVHPMVAYYDIYRRVSTPNSLHFIVKTYLSIKIISRINDLMRRLFRKPIEWGLFKIYPIYKHVDGSIIDKIMNPINTNVRLPLEASSLLEYVYNKEEFLSKRNIFIYGNYSIEILKRVALQNPQRTIYVCTPDTGYANTLYSNMRTLSNVNVLMWSPALNISLSKILELECALFVASTDSLRRDWRVESYNDTKIQRIISLSEACVFELNGEIRIIKNFQL